MELSKVDREVIFALESAGPCGITPLMPKCPSLESKVALKNVLQGLCSIGAAKLQDNGQYRIVKNWMGEAREKGWLTASNSAKPAEKPLVQKTAPAQTKASAKPAAEKKPSVQVEPPMQDISAFTEQPVIKPEPINPLALFVESLPDGVQVSLSSESVEVSWHGVYLEPAVSELPETLRAIRTLQAHTIAA